MVCLLLSTKPLLKPILPYSESSLGTMEETLATRIKITYNYDHQEICFVIGMSKWLSAWL